MATRVSRQLRRLAEMIEEIRAINPAAAEQLDQWIWDLVYGTPEDAAAAIAAMRQQLGASPDLVH
jgi:coproporphyrinogen III oxidase-like Fe-S oxidoreductase